MIMKMFIKTITEELYMKILATITAISIILSLGGAAQAVQQWQYTFTGTIEQNTTNFPDGGLVEVVALTTDETIDSLSLSINGDAKTINLPNSYFVHDAGYNYWYLFVSWVSGDPTLNPDLVLWFNADAAMLTQQWPRMSFTLPGTPTLSFDGDNAINHDGRLPDDVTLISATASPVPEPATMGLLIIGGLAILRRRSPGRRRFLGRS